jgi:hypothetical protein
MAMGVDHCGRVRSAELACAREEHERSSERRKRKARPFTIDECEYHGLLIAKDFVTFL